LRGEKETERTKPEIKKRLPHERRYQRATCDFSANFQWHGRCHEARARVISIGGCFLETTVMPEVGAELDFTLQLDPDHEAIHSRAKVAWVAPAGIRIKGPHLHPGFALEFHRIFPEDRARVDDYVRRQTRLFRAIGHELDKAKPDLALVKDLFHQVCPRESTHLNHIRKVCREELRFFRLRP
jgi:Tfp pilus assembly protein PilZ